MPGARRLPPLRHRRIAGKRGAQAKGRSSVSEWPGGTPRRVVAPSPPAMARASLDESVSSVPMPNAMTPAIGVSLPWGSYATVSGPRGDVPVVLGPAIHRQGKWALPLFWHASDGGLTERQLHREVMQCRQQGGYAGIDEGRTAVVGGSRSGRVALERRDLRRFAGGMNLDRRARHPA